MFRSTPNTELFREYTFRSSRPELLYKNVILKISENLQESTCTEVSFLVKCQAGGLQLYQKRDSGTGIVLWILRNFREHLFCETRVNPTGAFVYFQANINLKKSLCPIYCSFIWFYHVTITKSNKCFWFFWKLKMRFVMSFNYPFLGNCWEWQITIFISKIISIF